MLRYVEPRASWRVSYCQLSRVKLTQCSVVVGYHGYYGAYTKDFIEASLAVGIAQSHDVNTHKGTLGVTKVSNSITSYSFESLLLLIVVTHLDQWVVMYILVQTWLD